MFTSSANKCAATQSSWSCKVFSVLLILKMPWYKSSCLQPGFVIFKGYSSIVRTKNQRKLIFRKQTGYMNSGNVRQLSSEKICSVSTRIFQDLQSLNYPLERKETQKKRNQITVKPGQVYHPRFHKWIYYPTVPQLNALVVIFYNFFCSNERVPISLERGMGQCNFLSPFLPFPALCC